MGSRSRRAEDGVRDETADGGREYPTEPERSGQAPGCARGLPMLRKPRATSFFFTGQCPKRSHYLYLGSRGLADGLVAKVGGIAVLYANDGVGTVGALLTSKAYRTDKSDARDKRNCEWPYELSASAGVSSALAVRNERLSGGSTNVVPTWDQAADDNSGLKKRSGA